jgi:hypothetical protein
VCEVCQDQSQHSTELQKLCDFHQSSLGHNARPARQSSRQEPHQFFGLQRYWKHINSQNDYRNLLRFHGNWRSAHTQLLRLTNADIHNDHIVLHDPKGRTASELAHVVPLTNVARLALEQCRAPGEFAFTSDGGKTHLREPR